MCSQSGNCVHRASRNAVCKWCSVPSPMPSQSPPALCTQPCMWRSHNGLSSSTAAAIAAACEQNAVPFQSARSDSRHNDECRDLALLGITLCALRSTHTPRSWQQPETGNMYGQQLKVRRPNRRRAHARCRPTTMQPCLPPLPACTPSHYMGAACMAGTSKQHRHARGKSADIARLHMPVGTIASMRSQDLTGTQCTPSIVHGRVSAT